VDLPPLTTLICSCQRLAGALPFGEPNVKWYTEVVSVLKWCEWDDAQRESWAEFLSQQTSAVQALATRFPPYTLASCGTNIGCPIAYHVTDCGRELVTLYLDRKWNPALTISKELRCVPVEDIEHMPSVVTPKEIRRGQEENINR